MHAGVGWMRVELAVGREWVVAYLLGGAGWVRFEKLFVRVMEC